MNRNDRWQAIEGDHGWYVGVVDADGVSYPSSGEPGNNGRLLKEIAEQEARRMNRIERDPGKDDEWDELTERWNRAG